MPQSFHSLAESHWQVIATTAELRRCQVLQRSLLSNELYVRRENERVTVTRLQGSSVPSLVADDFVWVQLRPNERNSPYLGRQSATDRFLLTAVARCSLLHAAENFLDGFHTHFVHSGWIRHDDRRQVVTASVRSIEGGVEACYQNEGKQSGWLSTLLEQDRSVSMGRFRMPGIAEVEYRSRKGLTLLVTAWLTPESDDRTRIFARVATPSGHTPKFIKEALLRALFRVILRQDLAIVEASADNVRHFAKTGLAPRMVDGPLDLLGPSIRRLLAGQSISTESTTLTCRL